MTSARSCNKVGHLFWFTILAQHEINDVFLYIHSVHKHREFFSTSKLQDEIKAEKFELNKFHASKKNPFYQCLFFLIIMLVKYVSIGIDGIPQAFVFFRFVDIIVITVHNRFWNVSQANCILKYFENMMISINMFY